MAEYVHGNARVGPWSLNELALPWRGLEKRAVRVTISGGLHLAECHRGKIATEHVASACGVPLKGEWPRAPVCAITRDLAQLAGNTRMSNIVIEYADCFG